MFPWSPRISNKLGNKKERREAKIRGDKLRQLLKNSGNKPEKPQERFIERVMEPGSRESEAYAGIQGLLALLRNSGICYLLLCTKYSVYLTVQGGRKPVRPTIRISNHTVNPMNRTGEILDLCLPLSPEAVFRDIQQLLNR